MPNDWGDHGRVAGYVLAGVWGHPLEIRDRSVDWFELHSDDRLIPVQGDVDPAGYWD